MAGESELMPSYEAACDLYRGDEGAIWAVGLGLLSRAIIIGLGLYVAGERENLVRNALAGSIAVELFVLGWVWSTSPKAWEARGQAKVVRTTRDRSYARRLPARRRRNYARRRTTPKVASR